MTSQIFQLVTCNWRYWYCYVDYNLLAAKKNCSTWVTTDDLLDLYLQENNCPMIIDLMGGQPDLTPEWIVWMMKTVEKCNFEDNAYLWSDNNLNNNYFWKFLSKNEQKCIAEYKNYEKVGCFKGFSLASFSFNTGAEPEAYFLQFELFEKQINSGLNMYVYTTFTGPVGDNIEREMNNFVNKLQSIHEYLLLQTIPLQIKDVHSY